MNDKNNLISSQHLPFRIKYIVILILVIQTYFQAKLKASDVIIHCMSDPNSSDILSDGPVKYILRPPELGRCSTLRCVSHF
jgi:hypothetical protein